LLSLAGLVFFQLANLSRWIILVDKELIIAVMITILLGKVKRLIVDCCIGNGKSTAQAKN
jgi:hypothetical protein